MDKILYSMITKRKSFHIFKGNKSLSQREVHEVKQQIEKLEPLMDGIQLAWRLVPVNETSCKIGEYAILLYSEATEFAQFNAGYMLAQMDLWLASKNIGACFYGMGSPNEKEYEGLPFVMMLTIAKADEKEFAKKNTKARRKTDKEVWQGTEQPAISSIVRLAPSSRNSQPWLVRANAAQADVYRLQPTDPELTAEEAAHTLLMNQVDLGIFLLYMRLAVEHENQEWKLMLQTDSNAQEENLIASVKLA